MRQLPLLTTSALLVVLSLGCPPANVDDDGGVDAGPVDAGPPDAGPPDAGPPDAGRMRPDAGPRFTSVRAADWCRTLAQAQCWRDERCLLVEDAGSNPLQDCLTRRAEDCRTGEANGTQPFGPFPQAVIDSALRGGRMLFRADAGLACLNAYDTVACTREPASCESVFQGFQPADAGCLTNFECDQESGRCTSAGGAGQCPGFCRPVLPALSPCGTGNGDCVEGTVCRRVMDGGFSGLLCVAPAPGGSPCITGDECETFCINGVCAGFDQPVGAECNPNVFLQCGADSFCRQPLTMNPPPGVCEPRLGLGGTCVNSQSCQANLRCNGLNSAGITIAGACVPRSGRGGFCLQQADCLEGLLCDVPRQRCQAVSSDGGEDCSTTGVCARGFFCDFSVAPVVCKPRRGTGEACDDSGDCLSGDCRFFLDGGFFFGECQAPCVLRLDGGI